MSPEGIEPYTSMSLTQFPSYSRRGPYAPDHGVGKEDSTALIDAILLCIMGQSRGEKVLVLVMDCCSSGNCCLIDWLLTFLVDDLGLFSAAGIVYFWTNHGKGPADGRLV